MEQVAAKVKSTAEEALATGAVDKVLGWEKGDLWCDASPVFITNKNDAKSLIWDPFCVTNLSKYLIEELKTANKIGVFLKGCDTLGFNRLLKDHRIDADKVVIYGMPCAGMIDPEKVRRAGLSHGLLAVKRSGDELTFVTVEGEKKAYGRQFDYDKCLHCRYPNPVVYQNLMGEKISRKENDTERFAEVEAIEKMSAAERFDYWTEQFSKCIHCNACRNVCPACSCEKCVFDNAGAGVAGKAKAASEEQFFHLIRAYHVAGRCVDCGECSRVCPAGIPLHQLNRKMIKEINELYGNYEAGTDAVADSPLVAYATDDIDPFAGHGRGE